MSRIKEDMLRREDEAMAWIFEGYDRWLDASKANELSEDEIDLMERDFKKSLTVSNQIVSIKASNNLFFNPMRGA